MFASRIVRRMMDLWSDACSYTWNSEYNSASQKTKNMTDLEVHNMLCKLKSCFIQASPSYLLSWNRMSAKPNPSLDSAIKTMKKIIVIPRYRYHLWKNYHCHGERGMQRGINKHCSWNPGLIPKYVKKMDYVKTCYELACKHFNFR